MGLGKSLSLSPDLSVRQILRYVLRSCICSHFAFACCFTLTKACTAAPAQIKRHQNNLPESPSGLTAGCQEVLSSPSRVGGLWGQVGGPSGQLVKLRRKEGGGGTVLVASFYGLLLQRIPSISQDQKLLLRPTLGSESKVSGVHTILQQQAQLSLQTRLAYPAQFTPDSFSEDQASHKGPVSFSWVGGATQVPSKRPPMEHAEEHLNLPRRKSKPRLTLWPRVAKRKATVGTASKTSSAQVSTQLCMYGSDGRASWFSCRDAPGALACLLIHVVKLRVLPCA